MTITAMAGAGFSQYSAGAYTRSHVSETSEATITAGAARNKPTFVRAAHKRDRAQGRRDIRTQAQDWLASLDAEAALEAEQILADTFAEMQHEEYLRALEWEQKMAEAMADDLLNPIDRARFAEAVDAESFAGFGEELARLGMATTMTLEEAFVEGLRVTTRPSGYTYGRS